MSSRLLFWHFTQMGNIKPVDFHGNPAFYLVLDISGSVEVQVMKIPNNT